MSNTNEIVDYCSDGSAILVPMSFGNLKMKTDAFNQIEARVKRMYPKMSDESVKEVTRRFIRIKLKANPIGLAKTITTLDPSVYKDAMFKSAPQTQLQKVCMKTTEISYNDFRLLTNVEAHIRSSKNNDSFSIEDIEAAIKKYYQEVFVVSNEWPSEIYFLDHSVQTKTDLENLKKSENSKTTKKQDVSDKQKSSLVNPISSTPTNPKEAHPEQIHTEIQANNSVSSARQLDSYAYTNNGKAGNHSSSTQANEIEILPCQITYEDFRTLTNIQSCVMQDILLKFPGKSKRYLQQIDKYIKRHYENDFVKKPKWPSKVKFHDHTIRTLEDLILLKMKKTSEASRTKNNIPQQEINNDTNTGVASQNTTNIGEKEADINLSPDLFPSSGDSDELAAQANANAIAASTQEKANIPDTQSPNKNIEDCSHRIVQPSADSKKTIAKENHPPPKSNQSFAFCDVANVEESQNNEIISCSAYDPLTLNSNDLARMNVSCTSSTDQTDDTIAFNTHVQIVESMTGDATINSSPATLAGTVNRRRSNSQCSTDTDIFPPSANIRNQHSTVDMGEKQLSQHSESRRNILQTINNDTSLRITNAHDFVIPIKTEHNEEAVQTQCDRITSEDLDVLRNVSKALKAEEDSSDAGLEPKVILNSNTKQEFRRTNTSCMTNIPRTNELTICPNLNTIIYSLPSASGVSNIPPNLQSIDGIPTIKQEGNDTYFEKNGSSGFVNSSIDVQFVENEASEPIIINESEETIKNLLEQMMELPVTPLTPQAAVCNYEIGTPSGTEYNLSLANASNEFQSAPIEGNMDSENADNSQHRKGKNSNSCPIKKLCGKVLDGTTISNDIATAAKEACVPKNVSVSKADNPVTHKLTIERPSVSISDTKVCRLKNVPKTPKSNLNNSLKTTEKRQMSKLRKRTNQSVGEGVPPVKKKKVLHFESTAPSNPQVISQQVANYSGRNSKNTENTSNVLILDSTSLTCLNTNRKREKKSVPRRSLAESHNLLTSPHSKSSHSPHRDVDGRTLVRNEITYDKLSHNFAPPIPNSIAGNSSEHTKNTFLIFFRAVNDAPFCWITHLSLRPILNTAIDHIYCRCLSPILTDHEDPSLKLTVHFWRHKLLTVRVHGSNMNFRLGVNAVNEEAAFSFLEMPNVHSYSSNELVTVKALQNILERFQLIQISEENIIISSDYEYKSGEFYIRDDSTQQELNYLPVAASFDINNTPLLDVVNIVSELQCNEDAVFIPNENAGHSQMKHLPTESIVKDLNQKIKASDDNHTTKSASVSQQSLDSPSSTVEQHLIVANDENRSDNTHIRKIHAVETSLSQDDSSSNLQCIIKSEPVSEVISDDELNVLRTLCEKLKTEEYHDNEVAPTLKLEIQETIPDVNLINAQLARLNELIAQNSQTQEVENIQTTHSIQISRIFNEQFQQIDDMAENSSGISEENAHLDTNNVCETSRSHGEVSSEIELIPSNLHRQETTKDVEMSPILNESNIVKEIVANVGKNDSNESMVVNNVKDDNRKIVGFTRVPNPIIEKLSKENEVTTLPTTNAKNKQKENHLNTAKSSLKINAGKLTTKRKLGQSMEGNTNVNSDACIGTVKMRKQLKDISENMTDKRNRLERAQNSKPKRQSKVKTKSTNKRNQKTANNTNEVIVPQVIHNFRPLTLVSESKSGKITASEKQIVNTPRPAKIRRKQHNVSLNPDYFIEDTSQIDGGSSYGQHSSISQALSGDETYFRAISTESKCLDISSSTESADNTDTHPHDVKETSNQVLLIQSVPEQRCCWMTLLALGNGLNTAFNCIFYDSMLPLMNSFEDRPLRAKVQLRRHEFLKCEIFGDNLKFRLKIDAANEQMLFALLSILGAHNTSNSLCSTFEHRMIRIILQILQNFQKFSWLSIREEIRYSEFVVSSCVDTKSNNSGITLMPSVFFDKILKVFQISRQFE